MTDRDEERFGEIWDAWSGLILAYAVRRLDDRELAGDVVSETFLVAWRRMADVPAGDEARPWLYGVARRVLANTRRGQHRRERLDARLLGEFQRVVRAGHQNLTDSSDLAILQAAFAALRPEDREILTLVAWDGLDRDELGIVLGCSRANARVRLHRARARLDRELERGGLQRRAEVGHESTRASARSAREEA